MCPMAKATVRSDRPNASDTPAKPIPSAGNFAASTALPHPPSTNQNVPNNSAAQRRARLIAPSRSAAMDHLLIRGKHGVANGRSQPQSGAHGGTLREWLACEPSSSEVTTPLYILSPYTF